MLPDDIFRVIGFIALIGTVFAFYGLFSFTWDLFKLLF